MFFTHVKDTSLYASVLSSHWTSEDILGI